MSELSSTVGRGRWPRRADWNRLPKQLTRLWPEIGIVAAAVAAYHAIFANAFVFLDGADIADNPTIRHLWPLTTVLSPPAEGGLTVGGRPLVNLSLALNYAFGGTAPWGYHAVNLGIHVLAALTLFGIVRRTVERTKWREDATGLAFAVALLWALHPLQTESVTYVIQRAESLMGLFYFLTVYCFIRGASNHGQLWGGLTMLVCLCGMLTKEVMVSAPVMIFLYDRAFISGTFRQAWQAHRRLYLGMAGTWLALGWLVLHSGERGGSAGFGIGVPWGSYVLTQFPAILHYLRLTAWPHPLVFDYWVDWVSQPWTVAPAAAVVIALAGASVWGTFRPRAPQLAFLGLFFFAILAPTSLVPGKSQTMAEHRMYLALAPVLVGGVMAIYLGLGRRALMIFVPLAAVLSGVLTFERNRAYRDDLTLWTATVAVRPQNARAHFYRGVALGKAGRVAEEIPELRRALELDPDYPEADASLGIALVAVGQVPEAIGLFAEAARLRPGSAEYAFDWAMALARLGRTPEAIARYEDALRLNPDYPEAQGNLGVALATTGQLTEAIRHFERAAQLRPESAKAHYNLAGALVSSGRTAGAIAEYEHALRLKPDYYEAHYQLGMALRAAGRISESEAQLEQADRLQSAQPSVAP